MQILKVVFSTLAFARDEIFWYFNHFDPSILSVDQKKRSNKKDMRTNHYVELTILELLSVFKSVQNTLLESKQCFQEHVFEKLKTSVVPQLLSLLCGYFDENGGMGWGNTNNNGQQQQEDASNALLNSILQSVRQIAFSSHLTDFTNSQDLQCLRLNILRFQVVSTLPHTEPFSRNFYLDLQQPLKEFEELSRWLDNFDKTLERIGGLKELWDYNSQLLRHLKEALDTTSQPPNVSDNNLSVAVNFAGLMNATGDTLRSLGVFVHIAEDFAMGANPLWPNETFSRPAQAELFIKEALNILCSKAALLAHQIALENIRIASQLLPSESLVYLTNAIDKKKNGGGGVGFWKGSGSVLTEKAALSAGKESSLKSGDDETVKT
jgi:hypothetical protein